MEQSLQIMIAKIKIKLHNKEKKYYTLILYVF